MQLPTQTRDEFVQNAVTVAQAESNNALTFDIGSVTLALIEANIQNWLTIQAQIVILAATIRLSTCQTDSDVDSFIADFGLSRLPATPSEGILTFSRFTPTVQGVVPVGTLVQTVTGIQFEVTLDTTNPNYNSTLNGYVLAASVDSITVPAEASVAGVAGNVGAGTIVQIAQALPFVDSVTNAAPFTGGEDQESNEQIKIRFPLFFASLSRANKEALEYFISVVQDGIKYNLVENTDYTTQAEDLGQFYAVIDGGNGTASPELLASVYANLDRYRAFCVRPAVFAAIAVNVTIVATITINTGSDGDALIAAAEQAISDYISNPENITVGSTLKYNRLAGLIYDVSSDILVVDTLTVNGGTSDITATNKQSIVLSSISITVTP
jgi:phage-related baseplate assembly protein